MSAPATSAPSGVNRKVIDRSELILDIFAGRATTHEAQLQVEVQLLVEAQTHAHVVPVAIQYQATAQ